VYESAFQVFCESPYLVRNQPGSDFLKGIPSSWDETRVLEGMPGAYIMVARKSDRKWYVAGMSTDKRSFALKTDFLGNAGYRVTLWSDAADADRNPRKLVKKGLTCDRNSVICIDAMPGGGFVGIIEPAGENL
jgi:alpha-glucosidase